MRTIEMVMSVPLYLMSWIQYGIRIGIAKTGRSFVELIFLECETKIWRVREMRSYMRLFCYSFNEHKQGAMCFLRRLREHICVLWRYILVLAFTNMATGRECHVSGNVIVVFWGDFEKSHRQCSRQSDCCCIPYSASVLQIVIKPRAFMDLTAPCMCE